MANTERIRTANDRARAAPLASALALLATLASGCGGSSSDQPMMPPKEPFKLQSVESAANAPMSFTQPRAGVPLADGSVAFIATLEDRPETETTASGERVGVLLQAAGGGAPTVLYAGDALVNPFDIDASLDQKSLFVADPSAGMDNDGAILSLAVTGGEPTEQASGYRPRSITVAPDGSLYFSGVDPMSGEPGVFRLAGGMVTALATGAPFVDPSGIALMKDGRVLVADTRLFDVRDSATKPIASEAGIVVVKDGAASILT